MHNEIIGLQAFADLHDAGMIVEQRYSKAGLLVTVGTQPDLGRFVAAQGPTDGIALISEHPFVRFI